MGYFSNGTEGNMYEERWCSRCVHEQGADETGCPVMVAHALFNYDQHQDGKLKSVLDLLIPREGIFNAECRMFIERPRG